MSEASDFEMETADAIDLIDLQPQRQDSLESQLRDVRRAAIKLGCYDAADWINQAHDRDRSSTPGGVVMSHPDSESFLKWFSGAVGAGSTVPAVYCHCALVFDCEPANAEVQEQNGVWVPVCVRCMRIAWHDGRRVRNLQRQNYEVRGAA